MIISVHMPKTGGSSFRYLLEQHFKERILFDYADRPMSVDEQKRLYLAQTYNPKADSKLSQYDCVHGHFLAVKYKELIGKAQFVTWLRHPVERHISRYYHYYRNQKKLGNENILDVQTFCEKPDFQNIYAKYLQGMSLDDFDFIGITEQYSQSLITLSEKLNIFLPAEQANRNLNAQKVKGEAYKVTRELWKYLATLNHLDMALYNQALAMQE